MVRVCSIAQPRSALKHPHPRRSEKAHLRSKLAGLLASVVKVRRELAIEKDNRLADRQAILRATKTEDIDAALPGSLRRRAAEARAGICKPGSIHVQIEIMQLAFPGNRAQFIQCINGA